MQQRAPQQQEALQQKGRCRAPLSVHAVQVWDFNRSAEMRDTEGGASKRSVLEQVQKLRTYLAQE